MRKSDKPLKKPLRGFWRLHTGHYILMYRIDKKNQKITLVDYSHHDDAY
ncbi:type II toxin-antitoxin system RelE family toxin [Methanoregula sp.]